MSRSTVGASGKDTSSFHADISRLNTSTSNEPPMSHSDSTMDESLNCSTKRAFILSRNEQRAVRRDAEELNVSDDEILSEMDPEPAIDEGEEFFNQDEFSKLQNLSPDDFKVALDFSINVLQRPVLLPPAIPLLLKNRLPRLPQNPHHSIAMLPFSK
jgi:hypothetical protein